MTIPSLTATPLQLNPTFPQFKEIEIHGFAVLGLVSVFTKMAYNLHKELSQILKVVTVLKR